MKEFSRRGVRRSALLNITSTAICESGGDVWLTPIEFPGLESLAEEPGVFAMGYLNVITYSWYSPTW